MMHPHTAVSPHSQRGHREISPWPDGVVCVSHTLSFVHRISSQVDSIVWAFVNVCRQLTAAAHVLGQEHPETRTEIGLSMALGRA